MSSLAAIQFTLVVAAVSAATGSDASASMCENIPTPALTATAPGPTPVIPTAPIPLRPSVLSLAA